MKSIGDRIIEALELRGMKQSDLVNKTGIGKSSISTYISGLYEPKQKNIYKIAQALDVNETWLIGYEVPMDRSYNYNLDCKEILEEDFASDKSSFLNNMSKYYDLLNTSGREEALRRIKELSQLPQYNDENRKKNI